MAAQLVGDRGRDVHDARAARLRFLLPRRLARLLGRLDDCNWAAVEIYVAPPQRGDRAAAESLIPCTAVSGLYVHQDMLIKTLTAVRDVDTALILRGRAVLSQAIIVEAAYAQSEAAGLHRADKAGGKTSTNAATPSAGRAGDPVTADRASGTVARGDATSAAVSSQDEPLDRAAMRG